jgi:hypothetical protein
MKWLLMISKLSYGHSPVLQVANIQDSLILHRTTIMRQTRNRINVETAIGCGLGYSIALLPASSYVHFNLLEFHARRTVSNHTRGTANDCRLQ